MTKTRKKCKTEK